LLNDNVLHNVAFGQPLDQVDADQVWEALESAQIAETVADLPYGIYTQIGENGINLSGGQRQRIALARAFYRRSQFLVLDEATSALDNQTESDVIQALEIIGRRCTTVVIAHRMTTVQRCDRIYQFSEGRIVASGTYDSLLESSEEFRNLVRLEHQEY
jgi:ATP-binding cassette subfamily B protein